MQHMEARGDGDGMEQRQTMQELTRVSQGFHRVSMMAVDLLVMLVFADLGESCSQLFNQKWLRSNTAIETIFATLNDYGGDFKEHVSPAYVKEPPISPKHTHAHTRTRAHMRMRARARTHAYHFGLA